jgi:predicted dehydrogenase
VTRAIGTDDNVLRQAYRSLLLDSMFHELNAVRGLLGEPDEPRFADVWGGPTGVAATLRFGSAECIVAWVDLPGIARYEQELAFFGNDTRASLMFPSPFLRSIPTRLVAEGGEPGTATSWRTESTTSYEEAFKRELVELHACISEDREPRMSGGDALRDVALCQAIVAAARDGRPRPRPTDPEGV